MKILAALLMLASLPALSADLKVDFAFRDASARQESTRRTVVLQGSREAGAPTLESQCATAGQCECVLYRTENDGDPLIGLGGEVSKANHTFSCRVPGNSAEAARFVKLRLRVSRGDLTALLPIRTSLKLEDVMGKALNEKFVRGIYRYSCRRTFFEGEGVSPSGINCVPGQHLGVIGARYSFYIFRSAEDGNSPGGDSAFPSDICKRNNFLKLQCTESAPDLRYGLYQVSEGPFVVGIWMTRAPEATPGDSSPLTDLYGFAALPDEMGNCAPGLVAARPWVAQPSSVLPRGSNCPKDGCPSSFVNQGQLNDTLFEISQPAKFVVTREPNRVACNAAGDCSNSAFQGAEVQQAVIYASRTPKVCVIPPSLVHSAL